MLGVSQICSKNVRFSPYKLRYFRLWHANGACWIYFALSKFQVEPIFTMALLFYPVSRIRNNSHFFFVCSFHFTFLFFCKHFRYSNKVFAHLFYHLSLSLFSFAFKVDWSFRNFIYQWTNTWSTDYEDAVQVNTMKQHDMFRD